MLRRLGTVTVHDGYSVEIESEGQFAFFLLSPDGDLLDLDSAEVVNRRNLRIRRKGRFVSVGEDVQEGDVVFAVIDEIDLGFKPFVLADEEQEKSEGPEVEKNVLAEEKPDEPGAPESEPSQSSSEGFQRPGAPPPHRRW